MKKTDDNASIKWLRTAIDAEKKALKNYLNYAHLTKETAGKNMFIQLALDEHGHMTALEKELEQIQSGHKWQIIKLPESPIEQAVETIKPIDPDNTQNATNDETEAIMLAMKAEKKAMQFYQSQLKDETHPAAVKLLDRLVQMESAHYQILQSELDNINQTGFWMGNREISFEAE